MKLLIKYAILFGLAIVLIWAIFSLLNTSTKQPTDGDDAIIDVPVFPEPDASPEEPEDSSGGVIPRAVGFDPNAVRPLGTLFANDISQPFRRVLQNVYPNSYLIYSCQSRNHNAVMFTAHADTDGAFTNAKQVIRNWESFILQDIGTYLFPNQDVRSLDRPLTFAPIFETDIRRATVTTESETLEVYYGWRLNYVFIASSRSCLFEAMDEVYSFD